MTREESIAILDGFKHNPLFNGQHFEALDMAISALSDYDKMQEISLDLAFENDELINKSKWIPVSERLPEDGQRVNIKIQRKYTVYVTTATWDEKIGYFYNHDQAFDDVVAWR